MAARPRLLIVITLAEIGGAQTYVAGLLPALSGSFEVTVAAWGPGPLIDACRTNGVSFVPLRFVRRPLNPVYDLLGLLELIRLMRRPAARDRAREQLEGRRPGTDSRRR